MKHCIPQWIWAVFMISVGAMSGCALDDLLSFGESCPPEGEDGEISYIGNPYCTDGQFEQCEGFKEPEKYFEAKRCPRLYNICAPNEGDKGYHCESESKIVTQCAYGEIPCKDEAGNLQCLNPAGDESCGAKSCDEIGEVCASLDGRARCRGDRDKGYYCGCPDGDVLCGGRCITPSISNTNCGARGTCSSEAFASPDYQGDNCEAGMTLCSNGKCVCSEGEIWCVLNGKPGCYDPKDKASCNAHLMEDGIHCEALTCDEDQSCALLSADAYACQLSQCGAGKQLCMIEDEKACVSVTDTKFCGSCLNDCHIHSFENAHPKSCVKNNKDIPTCHYECDDGYTNCGNELYPHCIKLDSVYDCGACGKACKAKEICEAGECITTTCAANQCTIPLGGDKVSCVSTDDKCGADCLDCKNKHSNGFCKNGSCVISACNDGEHPVYSGSDITSCEKNTPRVCASKDMTPDQQVRDCTGEFPNAVAVECTPSGTCAIKECPAGQHLSGDKRSCVANSVTACGASTGTQTTNCQSQIANASNVKCQPDGSCSVVTCANGFHIASDGRSCAANTNTACGSTGSSHTTNCANGVQKVCNNGTCVCSADGSTVLNFDGNACVIAACGGIPGVQVGSLLSKSWYNKNYSEYACNPTKCLANYKQVSQGNEGKYFACLPSSSAYNCSSLGYKYSAKGYCIGKENGTGVNGHNHCAANYRQYITACIHKDVCCGTPNLNMTKPTDFLCTNCQAQGKTCNMTSGTCQ